MAMSQRTSHGSRPCSAAMSPTTRPRYCSFSEATTSKMTLFDQLASVCIGLDGSWATLFRCWRTAGSRKAASFSARGSNITVSHSGMASRTKPDAKLRRTPKFIGTVRATTLPPLCRA